MTNETGGESGRTKRDIGLVTKKAIGGWKNHQENVRKRSGQRGNTDIAVVAAAARIAALALFQVAKTTHPTMKKSVDLPTVVLGGPDRNLGDTLTSIATKEERRRGERNTIEGKVQTTTTTTKTQTRSRRGGGGEKGEVMKNQDDIYFKNLHVTYKKEHVHVRFTCSITGSNLILTLATLTCISLASYEYVPVCLGQKEKGNRPPPQPLSPAGQAKSADGEVFTNFLARCATRRHHRSRSERASERRRALSYRIFRPVGIPTCTNADSRS